LIIIRKACLCHVFTGFFPFFSGYWVFQGRSRKKVVKEKQIKEKIKLLQMQRRRRKKVVKKKKNPKTKASVKKILKGYQ